MGSLLKSMGKKEPEENTPAVDAAASPDDGPAYRELLRVLLDPAADKIVVEVNGRQFSAISQVQDRRLGQQILETTAALLKFTGGFIATAAGAKSLPVPEVKLTTAVTAPLPPSSDSSARPVDDAPSERKAPPRPEAPTATSFISSPQKQEKLRWGFGAKRSADEDDAPDMASFNLAEQIDNILQQKLRQANVPTTVKIYSGPGGHIQIQVGGSYYNAVDDVEDQNIRAIIQSAIDAW